MSPDYVAALAESVGALAVVISLLYVARQVRQTGQQARLATIHAVNSQFHTVMQLTAASPEAARVWTTGLMKGISALDDDEAKQFTQLLGLVVSSYQDLFYYVRKGSSRSRGFASSKVLTWASWLARVSPTGGRCSVRSCRRGFGST